MHVRMAMQAAQDLQANVKDVHAKTHVDMECSICLVFTGIVTAPRLKVHEDATLDRDP